MQDQHISVVLHSIASTAACPHCGTAGSRVHSRYQRTVADVACGGRRLVLKLLVRKWCCPDASCPQRIFAEQFPEVVPRYARMTHRLIAALQSVGVTTNGADAARILTRLAMPTTAKTIIRRVLQLPLPEDEPIRVAGIDEWAWKKGSRYGTILVDLERHRIATLLSERSTETSAAWFAHHPEVDWVARDRSRLFREAITAGAPQAQQSVDRFHLQKNFAEALERFLASRQRVLQTVAGHLAGQALAVAQAPASKHVDQERQRRHRRRVTRHKQIWRLFRAGQSVAEIAQIVGVGPRTVYDALQHEQPPARETRQRSHPLTDPYLDYLSERWNQGCHRVIQLYREVVAQGYTGSYRTMRRIVHAFRHSKRTKVHARTVTLRKAPSARSTALMIVRAAGRRLPDQAAFVEGLCQQDPNIAAAVTLAQTFGQLLRKREGARQLDEWKAAVQSSGIEELIRFVDGLAEDADAVANACSKPWNTGMVEGFIHKVKWIKRSSYGQAGFPLLQHRVLLHPTTQPLHAPELRSRSSPGPAHDRDHGPRCSGAAA